MNNNQNEEYNYGNENYNQYKEDEYGSIFLRCIAYMIDSFIISIIFGIIFIPSVVLAAILSENVGSEELSLSGMIIVLTASMISSILIVLYYCLMNSKLQGTLGKKICGLKVVNQDTGQNITFLQAFIRLVIFDMLGFISLIGLFMNKKKQTIHDLGAKSVVLKK